MRNQRWIGLALLLCSFVAMASGPKSVRMQAEASMLVTGTIDIKPDGSVGAHKIDEVDKLPQGVVDLVAAAVPHWKFEPVLVGGKPVVARTKMSLLVVGKKLDDDGYQLQVRSASFGSDGAPEERVTSSKLSPPKYPDQAAQNGVGGTVYLVLRVGRNGQVEDVIAEQVNLRVIDSDAGMKQWRGALTKTALRAARRWTFIPPTRGEDVAKPSWSVRVPVDFVSHDQPLPKYGEWQAYIPGPRQKAPWKTERDDVSTGPDALAAGGVYPIGIGPRLLTPLGGS